ncbi:hypothetical protein [Burkholderia ubonensis]|uniref:hypothetical protein n=1 Tax=Burkholderia ubonensis TaxID=101571 RepID=UPI0012FA4117|nr:hypothetical protein [Burkholderia ubonensis]
MLRLDSRLEQRLSNWFSASEQYSLQLHEIDRRDYMQMKQEEYSRQRTKQSCGENARRREDSAGFNRARPGTGT